MKPRKTTYKGIEMRSRLEAGFAAWLDNAGFDWEYEPQAFAGPAGQYLPDFKVVGLTVGARMVTAYFEVKPTRPDLVALRRRMQVIHASEPDAFLFVVIPGLREQYSGDPAVWLLTDNDEYPVAELVWVYRQKEFPPKYGLGIVITTADAPLADGFWEVI